MLSVLRRLGRAWRGQAPQSPPDGHTAVLRGQTSHVPGEYLPLYRHLDDRFATTVVLTFREMESLLGFALPAEATTRREWWTGPAVVDGKHSRAWTMASRIATPNLLAGSVAFERR
jgi:hypothetical protein